MGLEFSVKRFSLEARPCAAQRALGFELSVPTSRAWCSVSLVWFWLPFSTFCGNERLLRPTYHKALLFDHLQQLRVDHVVGWNIAQKVRTSFPSGKTVAKIVRQGIRLDMVTFCIGVFSAVLVQNYVPTLFTLEMHEAGNVVFCLSVLSSRSRIPCQDDRETVIQARSCHIGI